MIYLIAHSGQFTYDEWIYLGVSIVFMVFLLISWLYSRNLEPELEDEDERLE